MKPIIKWVGGKRKLVSGLVRFIPVDWPREDAAYYEPFAGSAALFFALWVAGRLPEAVTLSDANTRLMAMYKNVRSSPERVAGGLASLASQYAAATEGERRALYLQARDDFNSDNLDGPAQAALFLFLNKTGFNGLYRENQAGYFNVPWGKYESPAFPTREDIAAVSQMLTEVSLFSGDFSTDSAWMRGGVRAGDLVYCDSPYMPASSTSSFTSYVGGMSRWREPDDQIRLADWATELRDRGVTVILSNADVEGVRSIYGERGWSFTAVSRPGTVSCKGSNRGRVGEVIIHDGRTIKGEERR